MNFKENIGRGFTVPNKPSMNEKIVEIRGEIKLINQRITMIEKNHLKHLNDKIVTVQRILWLVLSIGLVNIFAAFRHLLLG